MYDEWLARFYLLRLLGSRFRVRVAGQPRDERDPAPAGDAGRAGSAQGLGEERARLRDPGVHGRAGLLVRLGRRRRGRSAGSRRRPYRYMVGAGIKTREEARARIWPSGRRLAAARRASRRQNWGSSIRITTSAGCSPRRIMRGPAGSPTRKPRQTRVQVAQQRGGEVGCHRWTAAPRMKPRLRR